MIEFEGVSPDAELDLVVAYFLAIPDFQVRAGEAIRLAIDDVIDGPRTGRWDIEQLEKTEKAYIGTKVEILLRAEFELPYGNVLDCSIDGVEVDIKYTIHTTWMIPGEALEHICLLVKASDLESTFSMGLLRITEHRLNQGQNKDGKGTIKAAAKKEISWLVQNGPLPENLLLHLAPEDRTAIMDPRAGGMERIRQLFRRVQNRVITRRTIESVAQQRDPLRRARQARGQLRPEGIIVICGTYGDQRAEAELLGLPVLAKDEWISTQAPIGWFDGIHPSPSM